MERLDPGDWYLSSSAVDPVARGLGVGSVLFENALERARTAESSRLVLDVETKNTRCEVLHERLGMPVEWTSLRAWLVAGATVNRMGMLV